MAADDDTAPPIEGRELGSQFDQQSILFSTFSDGTAFDYGEWEAADIDEMLERDGRARAIEQVLTLPLRSAPVTYTPGYGKAPAEVIEFVRDAMQRPSNIGGMSTSLNLIHAQMTGAVSRRRAFFEKVWKVNEDERWVYDKIAWRPASTCTIVRDKRTAAFAGFKQMPVRWDDVKEVWVKPKYAFVYLHGTHRDPIKGVSDLEIPLWCYKTKAKIRFLWYQYLEAQSLPKTMVKARDQGSADRVARKMIGLRQGGVVGLDMTSIDAIDTLESSGKGADQFMAALRYLDSESAESVLAGFLDLTGSAASGHGSLALSKDQTDFYLMSRKAVLREMADCENQYLIPDLVKYNFGTRVAVPETEYGEISEQDAAVAIGLLQAIASAPTLRLPTEFLDELVIKVAKILELPEVEIEKAIKDGATKALAAAATAQQAQVAPLVGGVNAAAKLVVARKAA